MSSKQYASILFLCKTELCVSVIKVCVTLSVPTESGPPPAGLEQGR